MDNIEKNFEQKNKLPHLENTHIKTNQEIFKDKIRDLLFYGNEEKAKKFNDRLQTILLKNWIERYMKSYDFSFFKKYTEVNNEILSDRLKTKLEKYFPLHENIIFKVLNEEIDKLGNKSEANVRNTINNFFKKYAHIIFIFSEKIKFSELENFLRRDLSNISYVYLSTKEDIKFLEFFEEEINQRIKAKLYERWDFTKEREKLIDEKIFSSMYRQLYREIEEKDDEEIEKKNNKNKKKNIEKEYFTRNKGFEIAKKIEEIYPTAVKNLIYIFETWIESGHDLNSEPLKNIKIIIRKLVEWVAFMKHEDIAFERFPEKRINPIFIKEFVKTFAVWNHFYLEEFEKLINAIFEDDKTIKAHLYNWLIESLKEKEKKSINQTTTKAERIENLNIKKVDFEAWQDVEENQKYEYVFSKIIAKNWLMKYADFLEFKSENLENLVNIFVEHLTINKSTEEKKLFKETIKKQIKQILKQEWSSIKKFVSYDINNLNFLIYWWRFILKIRTLKENWLEVNSENILKIEEKKYWIAEKISKILVDEKIIPSEKIIFSWDNKPRNTSVKTIDALIFDLTKWLRKWFINLNEEKIELINWEKRVIWSFQDLYIPNWLTEIWKQWNNLSSDVKIQIIKKYIDYAIDYCFSILRWESKIKNKNYFDELTETWIIPENTKISKKNYLKILIDNKILPENINNLSSKELDKIQHLFKILKFFSSRINHLVDMLKYAKQDKTLLEQNEKMQDFLKNENSDFGPDKSPDRALVKLIWEYGGNFNKLWDLIRLRIIWNDINESISQVINFIKIASEDENITNISISDKIWEPLSIPKEKSGYRDLKLLLKLKGWSTVEVQFQINDMYQIKWEWINLNENIFEKMKNERALFSKVELKQLINIAKERNIKLPKKEILENLTNWKNIKFDTENEKNIFTEEKISSDYTYHIIRQIERWSLKNKLTRLERVLADSAWSKIVLKYLKSKNILLEPNKKSP